MPTVKLDENAYNILEKIKRKLREQGINATFSDAVRYLYTKGGSNANKK